MLSRPEGQIGSIARLILETPGARATIDHLITQPYRSQDERSGRPWDSFFM